MPHMLWAAFVLWLESSCLSFGSFLSISTWPPYCSSTTQHIPASRPLHVLFSLPRKLFHPTPRWFTCSFLPDLYSKAAFWGRFTLATHLNFTTTTLSASTFPMSLPYLTSHPFCSFIPFIAGLLHWDKSSTRVRSFICSLLFPHYLKYSLAHGRGSVYLLSQ